MTGFKSSSELKSLAKDKLTGRYGTAMLLYLLPGTISVIYTYMLSLTISRTTLSGEVIYYVMLTAGNLIIYIFQIGISCYFLNLACGFPCTFQDLFYGFRNNTDKALILAAVYTALSFLLEPYTYLANLYLRTGDLKWGIYTCLVLAVSMIIYVPLSLMLSQAVFLILDFPDATVPELLRMSIKVMKGHKGRLFYLEASFIPLIMLAYCTLGIGFLWLYPYMKMTSTLFFLDIMHPAKQEEPPAVPLT